MSSRHKKLPVDALERIDDACIDFENQLQSGDQPQIEASLAPFDDPALREALLAELVLLDFDYRKKRGENPTVHEYRQRFPADAGVIERALNDCLQPTGPSRFEPPTVEELSELLPALEITELLGAGGMGAVYKARQKGLDRDVAIKVLPREIGVDVKFALRFTREARALAKLNHPHIVSVYEFGSVNGTYYFLMEFVDGSNLRQIIRAGELNPTQALRIVPLLCDALQYAHDRGVVHRDIKPENILLAKTGEVKIADFGLSRLLDHNGPEATLTGTHQVMGTPRYMAPEQLEDTHHVDHRADIYSLGVVFYEMLTGELPLGRFAAPSKKVEIDVRLDDVVLRTLEKEPSLRYQHASDVKSDLESIARHEGPEHRGERPDHPVDTGNSPRSNQTDLEQQELAGRVALLRRELIGRVSQSLRPLFWGQLIQMLIGVAFIALGVWCWARNQDVPHRLVSGALLHAYGAVMVIAAGVTCAKIGSLDRGQSSEQLKHRLQGIRDHYLRAGGVIGFAWWLMWIPLAVAVGLDAVVYPPALIASVVIGIIGLAISMILYLRVIRSDNPSAEKWTKSLTGESLNKAYAALGDLAKMEEA